MGSYVNGKKDGKGKFKWSDGATYEGDFRDNNIEGNYLILILKDLESMSGQMEDVTRDIGRPQRMETERVRTMQKLARHGFATACR